MDTSRFSVKTEQILEHALTEARLLGANAVAPEHLLLALSARHPQIKEMLLEHGLTHKVMLQELGYNDVAEPESPRRAEPSEEFGRRVSDRAKDNLRRKRENLERQAREAAERHPAPVKEFEDVLADGLAKFAKGAAALSAFLRNP